MHHATTHVHATEKDPFHFHLHDAMPWEPDEEPDQAISVWTELHEQPTTAQTATSRKRECASHEGRPLRLTTDRTRRSGYGRPGPTRG